MEYAACSACNNGTRGADAVAALMARIHPGNEVGSWQAEEMRKLVSAVDAHAPGVRDEMSWPDKARAEWLRTTDFGVQKGRKGSCRRTPNEGKSFGLRREIGNGALS